MKRNCFVIGFSIGLLFFTGVLCFGQNNFTRGEELLMQNKPAEAVVFLERSISEDPANVQTFLYLGIVYEQLGRNDEAITAYRRILPSAGNLTAYIANNLGNVYFQKGDTVNAELFYTQAIEFDRVYSSAFLGRANSRIKSGSLQPAISDYEQFLALEPQSPQRANIERLVSFIRGEFIAEERRQQIAAEEERVRLEQRQRLLDEISVSLQSVADSSRGLSAGVEDLEDYEGEFELE